jgi:hypothetical protein
MKKFLFLLIFSILSFAMVSNAQTGSKMSVVSGDTLTNADTTSKVLPITGGWSSLAIQPVVKRLSGTAAGSVVLYGSIDGVNYVATGDTLALTNQVTNTTLWKIGVPAYSFYKIVAISSGTVSEVLNVFYLVRRYQTN